MNDVIIIGGGVIGSAIARELSKYQLKTLVLEMGEDISIGATKANSGIIHGGYDADHKKLKGFFSRKGNQMFEKLEEELNFGFSRCGSLVLAFSEEDKAMLEKIIKNGILNGVDDLEIISQDQLRNIEPNVSKEALYALHCPSAGIASPYEFCIALMENAIDNGVELNLNTEVTMISKTTDSFTIETSRGMFQGKYIINCAGVNSDKISKLVGINDFHIIPRKGEYLVFQRGYGDLVNKVLFQCPTKEGKGILVTPTYHNNLMVGPNAQEVKRVDDIGTSKETLTKILSSAKKSIPIIDTKKVIRSFAGLRATSSTGDFIIGKTKVEGFINCAGVESPGLTSSPAIAKYVVDILKEEVTLEEKTDFNPIRERIVARLNSENTLNMKEIIPLTKLPLGNNDRIVCRCEQVKESTIREALDRGIVVDSTDGVKRRTRAGMGICQGAFCTSRVKEIISDHYNLPLEKVSERGKPSSDISNRIKRGDLD